MIHQAIELRNPIDAFMQRELLQWNNQTKSTPRKQRTQPKISQDVLTVEDWSILTEYLAILQLLKEASLRLEGRAQQGNILH